MIGTLRYSDLRPDGWPRRAPQAVRFERYVDRTGDCHIWTGCLAPNGYGHFDRTRAHRVAWTLAKGPIPRELWVLHRCNNPRCVNVAHLYLGTRSDNMFDAARAGTLANLGNRPTHCIRGHEFTPENTYVRPTPTCGTSRCCRQCNAMFRRRRYDREKASRS